jgi:glucan biosynthesis protein C
LIRIQPRQVPCRIDQIWLSRSQKRVPDTSQPVK